MILNRINEFVQYKGLGPSQFDKNVGFSNGFFSKALASGNMGVDKLDMILKTFPEINLEWLFYGDGPMLTTYDNDFGSKTIKEPKHTKLGVLKPFLLSSFKKKEKDNSFQQSIQQDDCRLLSVPLIEDYDFSIQAKGDSMINWKNPERSIKNGDIVVCKLIRKSSPYKWGEIYLLKTPEGYEIKKVQQSQKKDHVTCVPFNTEDNFQPYDLAEKNIIDRAIVIGAVHINSWG